MRNSKVSDINKIIFLRFAYMNWLIKTIVTRRKGKIVWIELANFAVNVRIGTCIFPIGIWSKGENPSSSIYR
jgi:hypothetical protein